MHTNDQTLKPMPGIPSVVYQCLNGCGAIYTQKVTQCDCSFAEPAWRELCVSERRADQPDGGGEALKAFDESRTSREPNKWGGRRTYSIHPDDEKIIRAYLNGPAPVDVSEGYGIVRTDHLVSSGMKARCIGEFSYRTEEPEIDEDGYSTGNTFSRVNIVPWDTCKEIYKGMLEAALLERAKGV